MFASVASEYPGTHQAILDYVETNSIRLAPSVLSFISSVRPRSSLLMDIKDKSRRTPTCWLLWK